MKITVYHGATDIIDAPLCKIGRPKLDFGQGFYDTDSALQQLAFNKPNNQICILNQELLNKYLRYVRTEEI